MNHQPLLFRLSLLLIAGILFSGCSGMLPSGAATPEDAAIHYARNMKMSNFATNQDSIESVQSAEMNHRVLVMVQFTGTRIPGGAETCQFVMENDKAQFYGWESHGGSGSCHANNDPSDTASITSGGSRGAGTSTGDPGYSVVYGDVRDPKITQVVVTWSDGHVQPVTVQQNSYLAAREGAFDMKKTVALDAQSETVYTIEP